MRQGRLVFVFNISWDVISVPLQTPITSSLREVVNLLVSGKAPQAVSKFMADGRLIALKKNKEGSPPDNRTIVVGESLKRLAGEFVPLSRRRYRVFPATTVWSGLQGRG